MGRLRMNFVVDTVGFASMLLLGATGALIRYVLPPGSGHFSTLWGMDRHAWGDIHFWIAVVLLATMVLHVVLHWSWVVCVVKGRLPERSGLRIAFAFVGLVALAALAVAPFLGTIEQTGEPPHRGRSGTEHGVGPSHQEPSGTEHGVGPSHQESSGAEHGAAPSREERSGGASDHDTYKIDGTTTLGEVERQTGVPVAVILSELGLPADLPREERLGRLRRQHDFQIHDIRAIVEKHGEQATEKDRP